MAENQSQHKPEPSNGGRACPIRNSWIRRVGFIGIAFFTIKGLLWLAVPGALVALGTCRGGGPAASTAEVSP